MRTKVRTLAIAVGVLPALIVISPAKADEVLAKLRWKPSAVHGARIARLFRSEA